MAIKGIKDKIQPNAVQKLQHVHLVVQFLLSLVLFYVDIL